MESQIEIFSNRFSQLQLMCLKVTRNGNIFADCSRSCSLLSKGAGTMPKTKKDRSSAEADVGGFMGGLTNLIEKLGDLAEKGKDLHELKEFGDQGGVKGVYGFTIRTGIGGERSGGVKVEPFGNVREKTSERERRQFKN